MFDFGCGEETFRLRLLEALGPSSARIAFTLAEPVGAHLACVREQMVSLVGSVAGPPADPNLSDPSLGENGFDLILANHCLYYVSDPERIVGVLAERLAPGGTLIAPMLDRDSTLAGL